MKKVAFSPTPPRIILIFIAVSGANLSALYSCCLIVGDRHSYTGKRCAERREKLVRWEK
jgi:hypothetical protein